MNGVEEGWVRFKAQYSGASRSGTWRIQAAVRCGTTVVGAGRAGLWCSAVGRVSWGTVEIWMDGFYVWRSALDMLEGG